MSRLAPAAIDNEVAARIRQRRGGGLRPLDLALLHSPPVADGWNALLGAVRGSTTIPGALREAIILRIAVLNRAEYEWVAHEPVGRSEGLTDTQLASLRDGSDPPGFGPGEVAALAFTEAMTLGVQVPAEVFEALRGHFDDRAIVEVTATAAAYNMVSRFLVALEITPPSSATAPPSAEALR